MQQTQRDDEGGQLPPEQPDTEGGSFGRWLRRHREVRGIDLREIADSSKIGISYLRAFEEDRFDLLPADIFAKGFLRQYAAYVGLDPEEVVNFYLSACQAEAEDDESTPAPRSARGKTGARLVVVALAVLALLALIFWWISQRAANPQGSPATSTPSAASTSPAPTGATATTGNAGAAETVESDPPSATPSDSSSTVDPTQDASATTPSDPGAAVDPSGASAQGTAPAASTPGSSNSAPAVQTVAVSEAALRVSVDFAGECWVEAVIDGVQRVAEIKVQGESLLLEANDVIDLKVGNVEVVRVEVNDSPYPLERRRGTAVRSVRIDRATVEALQRPTESTE